MTSARAMASCCCWPPERSPPRRPSMDLSTGNSSNSSSAIVALVARQAGKAGLEVLLHGQQREDLAALRHVGDAAPRPLVGLQAGDVLPVEQDACRALTGWWPTMARSSELLPTPLRPSTQVILPRSAVDRDVAQRLRRAVVQIDVLNRQHVDLLILVIPAIGRAAGRVVRGAQLRAASRQPPRPGLSAHRPS